MQTSLHNLKWELAPCQLHIFPFARHPICPTFVWLLTCRTKKYSHVRYPTCLITMMFNVPIDSKGSFFQHPTCLTLYPLIRLPNILACFVLFWFFSCTYEWKPSLSATGQDIPCKTRLKGNFQFSHYKYCYEALDFLP